jgi:DMSO/TMAO reductase YedYZ molybdopterin-dependent catalytic subunit
VPPGQYVTDDFPVLSAGRRRTRHSTSGPFSFSGEVTEAVSWPWDEFLALPSETVTVDIHCVTKWSKLDTTWKGVSVDTLLGPIETEAEYLTAWCDGGYTTNLALEDITEGKAWVAYEYGGQPARLRARRPGAPARAASVLLEERQVGARVHTHPDDEPGFWETYGYHNHGDPWLEQRYQGD